MTATLTLNISTGTCVSTTTDFYFGKKQELRGTLGQDIMVLQPNTKESNWPLHLTDLVNISNIVSSLWIFILRQLNSQLWWATLTDKIDSIWPMGLEFEHCIVT